MEDYLRSAATVVGSLLLATFVALGVAAAYV